MLIAPGVGLDAEALATFCRSNAIRRLAVFGSALRDDFRPDSDVDLLVEIVGEAAKQPTASGRIRFPGVAWDDAARMRDRLVHH